MTGTRSVTLPAFWKLSTIVSTDPPPTDRVSPVSSAWGCGPPSSTTRLGGRLMLPPGRVTAVAVPGAWTLSRRSPLFPSLTSAKYSPADCPAGSAADPGAPSTNTFLIEMACVTVPTPSVG